jgi:subfamily B ATP-binding cassette protein HlyB/CyaB
MVSMPSAIERDDFVWALGAMCRVHRMAFDPARVLQQFPPPYSVNLLLDAARALGFAVSAVRTDARRLSKSKVPCLVTLAPAAAESAAQESAAATVGLLLGRGKAGFELVEPRAAPNGSVSLESFGARFSGDAIRATPSTSAR